MVMFPRMNNPALLCKQVLPLDLVLLVFHVLECFEEKDLLIASSLNFERLCKIKSYILRVGFGVYIWIYFNLHEDMIITWSFLNLYVLQLIENDNLRTAVLWNNPCSVPCVNYIPAFQVEKLYILIKKYRHWKWDMIRIREIN